MEDLSNLRAKAKVTLTKIDNDTGKVIGIEVTEIDLSEEEAKQLWLSQQQL